MIEWLEALLGGEEDVPEHEQCNQKGCSNPAVLMGECEECNEAGLVKADARAAVAVGDSAAAYERRCFDCQEREVLHAKRPEQTPGDRCSACGSADTTITPIAGEVTA
jgi:hypothetical protein